MRADLKAALATTWLALAAGGCGEKTPPPDAPAVETYPKNESLSPWLSMSPNGSSLQGALDGLQKVLYPRPGPDYPGPAEIEEALKTLKRTPGVVDAKLVAHENRRTIMILNAAGQQIFVRLYAAKLHDALRQGSELLKSKLDHGTPEDRALAETAAFIQTLPGGIEAKAENHKGRPALRVSIAADQFDHIVLSH